MSQQTLQTRDIPVITSEEIGAGEHDRITVKVNAVGYYAVWQPRWKRDDGKFGVEEWSVVVDANQQVTIEAETEYDPEEGTAYLCIDHDWEKLRHTIEALREKVWSLENSYRVNTYGYPSLMACWGATGNDKPYWTPEDKS